MAKQQQDAAKSGKDNDTAKPSIDETVFGALTESDLASMTEEERAAMAPDDDDEDADAGADAGDEGDADADGENDAGEDADTDRGADADAGEDEGEGADADADAGEGEGEGADADADAGDDGDGDADAGADAEADTADDDGPAIPDYKMPEKAKEQLAGFEAKAKEIADKFDAGDISAGEFHAQMAANSDAKGKLLSQIDKAEWAQDQRVAHFTKAVVPRFLKEHPEYNAKDSPVLYRALDGELRVLQNAAGQKGENYLSGKLLRQAHANVQKAFGRKDTAQPGKDGKQKAAKGKLPDKGGKPDTPRTLARVPADGGDAIDEGGKHARLDRLADRDPTAYEEALARLPQAERDEYLRWADA